MRLPCISLVVFTLLAACETVPLAPGADKVRITNSPSDVANCKAVGILPGGTVNGIENQFAVLRNKTVGLGGNTVLLLPASDIAYVCP